MACKTHAQARTRTHKHARARVPSLILEGAKLYNAQREKAHVTVRGLSVVQNMCIIFVAHILLRKFAAVMQKRKKTIMAIKRSGKQITSLIEEKFIILSINCTCVCIA